jgi:hypothetical protein
MFFHSSSTPHHKGRWTGDGKVVDFVLVISSSFDPRPGLMGAWMWRRARATSCEKACMHKWEEEVCSRGMGRAVLLCDILFVDFIVVVFCARYCFFFFSSEERVP